MREKERFCTHYHNDISKELIWNQNGEKCAYIEPIRKYGPSLLNEKLVSILKNMVHLLEKYIMGMLVDKVTPFWQAEFL